VNLTYGINTQNVCVVMLLLAAVANWRHVLREAVLRYCNFFIKSTSSPSYK
jgi:hypothetical protein